MSHEECLNIQGFKGIKSYPEAHEAFYFTIGNAVNVGVVTKIAKNLLKNKYDIYAYSRNLANHDFILKKGIKIIFDNSVSALNEILLSAEVQVIYSAAIPNSHPQLEFYKKQGNNVNKRAEFLAKICNDKKTLRLDLASSKSLILLYTF